MDAELIKTHNGIGLILITNKFFLNTFNVYCFSSFSNFSKSKRSFSFVIYAE